MSVLGERAVENWCLRSEQGDGGDRRDGRELVYWQPPAALMSVELRYDSAGVHSSTPVTTLPPHIGILTVVDNRHHHAMSADGQRWLLREPAGPPGPPLNVIVNWVEALRR